MKIFSSNIKRLFTLLAAVCLLNAVNAQDLMIASGAGYKKPVTEVVGAFKEKSGLQVDVAYGNIQMVANQAKQTDEISCIIGDKKFLAGLESVVQFTSYQNIGKGILVLAYRNGITINDISDLLSENIKSVFMPQDGKAIYGVAAAEALKSYGYTDQLAAKTSSVATVPQVVSYLLTGEADAGFINLTEAVANKDKLGGYIIIPQDKYTDIMIVAGVVKGFEENANLKSFISFLTTEQAISCFKKYGVE